AVTMPVLSGSPELGGIDPAQPIPRLNLAGRDGSPLATQVAHVADPASASIHTPDFKLPDMEVPDLHPYDLVAPGIDYAYERQFKPDPRAPDLSEYAHPHGLDIHGLAGGRADLFQPDPIMDGQLQALPDGLALLDDPLRSDPTLPDLQHP